MKAILDVLYKWCGALHRSVRKTGGRLMTLTPGRHTFLFHGNIAGYSRLGTRFYLTSGIEETKDLSTSWYNVLFFWENVTDFTIDGVDITA